MDREGVHYVCDAGLRLLGPKAIFCLANGTWSLPLPECESTGSLRRSLLRVWRIRRPIKSLTRSAAPAAGGCDPPKQVPHGRAQEHNLNTGRAVEVQCDNGYDLVGEALVVCMGGGAWSAAFPTCQRERRHPQKRKRRLSERNDFKATSCSLQPSAARHLQAGGMTTTAAAALRWTSTSDSRSGSPVLGAMRSKAAAPSPAGRTRPGARSAPCAKVGERVLAMPFSGPSVALPSTDRQMCSAPYAALAPPHALSDRR